MLKSARDYTNCSVNIPGDEGPRCGGSFKIDTGRFDIYTPEDDLYGSFTVGNEDEWVDRNGYVWNFAPYNYLQRPDERWAAGAFLNYEFKGVPGPR